MDDIAIAGLTHPLLAVPQTASESGASRGTGPVTTHTLNAYLNDAVLIEGDLQAPAGKISFAPVAPLLMQLISNSSKELSKDLLQQLQLLIENGNFEEILKLLDSPMSERVDGPHHTGTTRDHLQSLRSQLERVSTPKGNPYQSWPIETDREQPLEQEAVIQSTLSAIRNLLLNKVDSESALPKVETFLKAQNIRIENSTTHLSSLLTPPQTDDPSTVLIQTLDQMINRRALIPGSSAAFNELIQSVRGLIVRAAAKDLDREELQSKITKQLTDLYSTYQLLPLEHSFFEKQTGVSPLQYKGDLRLLESYLKMVQSTLFSTTLKLLDSDSVQTQPSDGLVSLKDELLLADPHAIDEPELRRLMKTALRDLSSIPSLRDERLLKALSDAMKIESNETILHKDTALSRVQYELNEFLQTSAADMTIASATVGIDASILARAAQSLGNQTIRQKLKRPHVTQSDGFTSVLSMLFGDVLNQNNAEIDPEGSHGEHGEGDADSDGETFTYLSQELVLPVFGLLRIAIAYRTGECLVHITAPDDECVRQLNELLPLIRKAIIGFGYPKCSIEVKLRAQRSACSAYGSP